MTSEPHSAAYFIEQRDFWFHDDWLALLARRLRLADVRRALDVGSGQGHWTMLLAPLLAPDHPRARGDGGDTRVAATLLGAPAPSATRASPSGWSAWSSC
jgi:hypothetical protein